MSASIVERHWVGFDLGGTKMLAVVFDDSFKPVARKRRKTRPRAGAKAGVEQMVGLIEDSLSEAGVTSETLAGIGVGCPGPLDLNNGIVLEMPNLGWKKIKMKAEFEGAFGCPTIISNDVDAGLYGEYRFGAARNARCAVGVFAGTGIGGAAIYDGEIIRGATGSCMEIGHVPVIRGGPLCGCGRRGCLEAVAGRLAISAAAAAAVYRGEAPNLARSAGTDLSAIRSRALAEAIAGGDGVIETLVREAAQTIGWVTAGVVNLLAPDVIVLGGGLVEDMPVLFCEEVGAAITARVMPSFKKLFRVVPAELAGDATVIGAAALARHVAVK